MTQDDLAELAGLSKNMIGKLERGKTGARFPNIEKLSAALDVDYALLFTADATNPVIANPKLQMIILRLAKMPDADLDWVNDVLDSVLTRRA